MMDRFVGRTFAGRYVLDELIGRGGTADTYRATDKVLERDVAVMPRGNQERVNGYGSQHLPDRSEPTGALAPVET